MIEELLVEELRDQLSAEGHLVKALPKITKAANAGRLKVAFENHLEETGRTPEGVFHAARCASESETVQRNGGPH